MSVQSYLWICESGNLRDSLFNCNSSRSQLLREERSYGQVANNRLANHH
jgi:hypothetical protein